MDFAPSAFEILGENAKAAKIELACSSITARNAALAEIARLIGEIQKKHS